MNVFVIKLEKDKIRKYYIDKHFVKYSLTDYKFIKAIYGKDLDAKALAKNYDKILG